MWAYHVIRCLENRKKKVDGSILFQIKKKLVNQMHFAISSHVVLKNKYNFILEQPLFGIT